MPQLREIPWVKISAEGVAIVVSILLAFGIQAWWEDKQTQLAEREVLSALIADLEEKRSQIPWGRQFADAIMQSAERLISVALNDSAHMESNEIDRLLGDLWWYNVPEQWTTGFLESLALSGQLSTISNARLRNSLGELRINLHNVGRYASDDKEFVMRRQLPYLSENAFLPQILNAVDHTPGHPEEPYVHRTDTNLSFDHADLLEQRQFQNLLMERVDRLKSLNDLGWSDLEEILNQVLDLLHAELGEES
jgi:hypothetical protein